METRTDHRYALGLIGSLGFLTGILASFIVQTFLGLFFVIVLFSFFRKVFFTISFRRFFLGLLFLVFGFFYYTFFILGFRDVVHTLVSAQTLSGVVVSLSPTQSIGVTYTIRTREGIFISVTDRVSSSTATISYGAQVLLSGYHLDATSGGKLFIRYPSSTVVGDSQYSIIGFLIRCRQAAVRILAVHLPPEAAALSAGMLFGDTTGFTKHMKDVFAATGTTHIVALSGYNVMLIAFFVQICLARFLNRRIVFVFTLIVVALFVVVTGASASSVRAAVMYGIFGVAYELGRGRVGVLAAVYGAAIMNVYDPTMVVSNIGFQLSFASLFGIIVFTPRFLKLIPERVARRYSVFFELCCTGCAAQLSTLPFIVWYFGTVSGLSVLVNVLVSLLVPFATIGAFMVVVLGSFSYFLAWPTALVLTGVLQFQLAIIATAARVPFHTTITGTLAKILICGVCVLCMALLFRKTIANRV